MRCRKRLKVIVLSWMISKKRSCPEFCIGTTQIFSHILALAMVRFSPAKQIVLAKTITALPTTAYPSVLGDMLSSGIASIGFSWVSIFCEWQWKTWNNDFCISKKSNFKEKCDIRESLIVSTVINGDKKKHLKKCELQKSSKVLFKYFHREIKEKLWTRLVLSNKQLKMFHSIQKRFLKLIDTLKKINFETWILKNQHQIKMFT